MRTNRTTGVIVSTALVGALAFGTTGAAFASSDTDSSGTGTSSTAPAAPDAATLLAQSMTLGKLGAVLTPVTDAVKAVLGAPGNKLSAEDATKGADAIKAAITAAMTTAAALPGAPALPAAPAVPGAPVVPAVPAAPAVPGVPAAPQVPVLPKAPALPKVPARAGTAARGVNASLFSAPRAADPTNDALTGLQKAVDDLLKTSASDDPTGALGKVLKVVTDLVNVLLSSLLGGSLPAADLPGLPKLPALPALPAQVPAPPVQAPVQAPAPAQGLTG